MPLEESTVCRATAVVPAVQQPEEQVARAVPVEHDDAPCLRLHSQGR